MNAPTTDLPRFGREREARAVLGGISRERLRQLINAGTITPYKLNKRLRLFDLKKALSRRNMPGAPGTKEVAKQLARWKKLLA